MTFSTDQIIDLLRQSADRHDSEAAILAESHSTAVGDWQPDDYLTTTARDEWRDMKTLAARLRQLADAFERSSRVAQVLDEEPS